MLVAHYAWESERDSAQKKAKKSAAKKSAAKKTIFAIKAELKSAKPNNVVQKGTHEKGVIGESRYGKSTEFSKDLKSMNCNEIP